MLTADEARGKRSFNPTGPQNPPPVVPSIDNSGVQRSDSGRFAVDFFTAQLAARVAAVLRPFRQSTQRAVRGCTWIAGVRVRRDSVA